MVYSVYTEMDAAGIFCRLYFLFSQIPRIMKYAIRGASQNT